MVAGVATIRDPAWFAEVVRHASDLTGHPTQAALAEAAGLSLNTVVNVVTAARDSYRPGTLEQLARGLGVDAIRLLACATTGTGTRPRRPRTSDQAPWAGMTAVDAAAHLTTPHPVDDTLPSSAAVFVVSVDGVDASEVEWALAATLARLATRHAGAQTRVRALP
jgi:hypothetical protein